MHYKYSSLQSNLFMHNKSSYIRKLYEIAFPDLIKLYLRFRFSEFQILMLILKPLK